MSCVARAQWQRCESGAGGLWVALRIRESLPQSRDLLVSYFCHTSTFRMLAYTLLQHRRLCWLTVVGAMVVRMRLQYRRLADYEQRRRVAMATGAKVDFDLIDAHGNVLQCFEQEITWEQTTDAYIDALHPPHDDCMERHEQRRHAHLAERRVKPSPRPRVAHTRNRRRRSPLWQRGPIPLDYTTGPARPAGNVVEF